MDTSDEVIELSGDIKDDFDHKGLLDAIGVSKYLVLDPDSDNNEDAMRPDGDDSLDNDGKCFTFLPLISSMNSTLANTWVV